MSNIEHKSVPFFALSIIILIHYRGPTPSPGLPILTPACGVDLSRRSPKGEVGSSQSEAPTPDVCVCPRISDIRHPISDI